MKDTKHETALAEDGKKQRTPMKSGTRLKFETEEQEARYWDSHSPLDAGIEPKVEKVRVKLPKDRPISIRLDSESRRKLEQVAKKRGLGPSTFARNMMMAAVQEESGVSGSLHLKNVADRLDANLPRSIRDQAESLLKAVAVGDPKNRTLLLVDSSQMKAWEELGRLLIKTLLTVAGIKQYPMLKGDATNTGPVAQPR